jgi:hypothetical protein
VPAQQRKIVMMSIRLELLPRAIMMVRGNGFGAEGRSLPVLLGAAGAAVRADRASGTRASNVR